MFQKCLKIELQGCNRRFQFVGKVVDKVMLQPVQPQVFEIIDKYDENSHNNDTDKYRENHDNEPCLGGEELSRIEVEALDDRLEATADFNIPVNIEKKRCYKCQNREDQYKNRMDQPFCSVHVLYPRKSVNDFLLYPIVKLL